ncbi:MAG: (2Fe-2S)-binding protein [Bdellovibrionaceae bacterium]|nr:(2Fe-2S)-binding protein [Pseudobdellovibrionaceae bacterium]MBX3032670.1 (2Fe-2S)-binding protein [Pseudobdellovibrionaceae bacterium]
MPVIRRARQGDLITVEVGAVLMNALQDAGVPVASSCGGEAVCAKCVLKVLAGGENLSPPTPDELFLREKDNLPADTRVSCQARVLGDVTVDARYW